MGAAVFGYANKTREDGTKYIAPKEPEATVMRWVFGELARGIFNTEQVWRMAQKRGFTKKKANFWQIIRNPVYCGKIIVPKYKNDDATLAKGLHEPLISEALFYEVQSVLDGRKRVYRTRMTVDEQIPLRGFLICPRCGRNLSASASTGYSARYYYYHCTAKCGFRSNAQKVNADFEKEIRKYTPHPGIVDLYKQVININYFNKNKGKREDLEHLKEQRVQANNDLAKARKLLLAETIDASDFKAIKTECEEQITRLEAKISTLSQEFNSLELKQLLEKATASVSNLDILYHDADVYFKRQIISAVYPQKLEYDGYQFRTVHLNEVIATTFGLDAAFRKEKSGQNGAFSILSAKEVPSRFELL